MNRRILANLAGAAAIAGTLAVASSPAQALPAGLQPLPLASAGPPEVTLVSGGCGPYGHRTPWGACRPNVVAPLYGYRRPYGWNPGWHRWHHW
jgi:hypothetical protein